MSIPRTGGRHRIDDKGELVEAVATAAADKQVTVKKSGSQHKTGKYLTVKQPTKTGAK